MNKRREWIRETPLALLGISLWEGLSHNQWVTPSLNPVNHDPRYPAVDAELCYQTVSAAHFDLDKVKTLVIERPELANAGWDWGFGDFETAIGACSHTGRRDIAEFLINAGARPDIFTLAMLGMLNSLKEIIETLPGIQSRRGPHGITLLKHAQNRLANKEIDGTDKQNVMNVIEYLQMLGNADEKALSLSYSDEDKILFLGDYRFGDGETELFNIGPYSQDPTNFIRISRKGLPGRLLHKIGDNTFSPTGAPSVKIVFEVHENKVLSLTIFEPNPVVKAVKI